MTRVCQALRQVLLAALANGHIRHTSEPSLLQEPGQRSSDHGAGSNRRRAATEPNTPTSTRNGGMPDKRSGQAPAGRPHSRPLSRRTSNATLGGAAPDTLRHNGHGSRTWGQPSETSSHAEFVSTAAWSAAPGSPNGDTSSALYVDARQDSCQSSQDDLTQHSGSLYTATSALSQFVQGSSVSGAPSDAAYTPRSNAAASAMAALTAAGAGTSREALLRTVNGQPDGGPRPYMLPEALSGPQHAMPLGEPERSATAMEIVSGALAKPNAWAAGAPAWERGGEGGPGGQGHLPTGAVTMGPPMQQPDVHYHPQYRGIDQYELTRNMSGNRGGHGGRLGHHGDAMGGGGRIGYGGDGPGRGGRHKSGRGHKMRSNSTGSFGGGRDSGAGNGGRGHRHGRGGHQQTERQGPGGNTGNDRGAAPRAQPIQAPDAGRGNGAAVTPAAAAAAAPPDPRLLLDNAQQFPALDGGSAASPRAVTAAAAAAQWPAKDRLAAVPAAAAEPPAAPAASEARRAARRGGSSGASGRLVPEAAPPAHPPPAELPSGPPLSRAWSDQAKERFGSRSGAEVRSRGPPPHASADSGSRHAGAPARKSSSSWSEVAQTPAIMGVAPAGRGGGTRGVGGGGSGGYGVPAPASDNTPVRPWHMPSGRSGMGSHGRVGAGRRGGFVGPQQPYPAAYATSRPSGALRRGRSVEGGARTSDARSSASIGR